MISKITDNLYIGNADDAKSPAHFTQYDINTIVNVAIDLEDPWYPHIRSYKVGLLDGPGNKLYEYVIATKLVLALILDGKKVLVHCHEGVSRSVAIAVLALACTYTNLPWNIGLSNAEDFIKQRRPFINIKYAHREFMKNAMLHLTSYGDGRI